MPTTPCPPREAQLQIPFMAPSLNSLYSGLHWSRRKQHADAGHRACLGLNIAPFTGPVRLRFTPIVGKGGRVRDCSNYAYTAKIIEDGLVQAGILADDSAAHVHSITLDAPVLDRRGPSAMLLHIQAIDPDTPAATGMPRAAASPERHCTPETP